MKRGRKKSSDTFYQLQWFINVLWIGKAQESWVEASEIDKFFYWKFFVFSFESKNVGQKCKWRLIIKSLLKLQSKKLSKIFKIFLLWNKKRIFTSFMKNKFDITSECPSFLVTSKTFFASWNDFPGCLSPCSNIAQIRMKFIGIYLAFVSDPLTAPVDSHENQIRKLNQRHKPNEGGNFILWLILLKESNWVPHISEWNKKNYDLLHC